MAALPLWSGWLIGGVAVMLHIERLGLDVPLRATGDADFGVPTARAPPT